MNIIFRQVVVIFLMLSTPMGVMSQSPLGNFIYPHFYADSSQLVNQHIASIQFLQKSNRPTVFTKIYLDEHGKMYRKDVNPCYNRLKYLMQGILLPHCSFVLEYNHTEPYIFACPTKSNYSSCECDSNGRIKTAKEHDISVVFHFDSLGRYSVEEVITPKQHNKTIYHYNTHQLVKIESININDSTSTLVELFEFEYNIKQPQRIKAVKRYAKIGDGDQLIYVGSYTYTYNSKDLITKIRFVDKYYGVQDLSISIKYEHLQLK